MRLARMESVASTTLELGRSNRAKRDPTKPDEMRLEVVDERAKWTLLRVERAETRDEEGREGDKVDKMEEMEEDDMVTFR